MSGIAKRSVGRVLLLRMIFFVALAVGGALAAGTAASRESPVAVLDLRVGYHPGYTRLVLEIGEPVAYYVFALVKPNRLVIDFPELAFPSAVEALGPGGIGVISAIRHGLFRPGTSRIVLDLHDPVSVKQAFLMSPRDGRATRFVMDLARSDLAAFAQFARDSQRNVPPPPPARAVTPRTDDRPVIVVDAGHGGIDPGAVGRSGVFEKDIALAAAQHLAERLAATRRYRVVMTRERDVFVGLRDRVAIARAAGADLFLSIHADSIDDSRVRGSHVYTLSQKASDAEAAALAEKENKSDVIAGLDLASYSEEVNSILLDLSQRETNNLSARLADMVVEAFVHRGVPSISRPHRQAGFAVLKAPDVPSLLVELGFLSNREDERKLQTRRGREPVLDAVIDAVDRHFAVLPAAN